MFVSKLRLARPIVVSIIVVITCSAAAEPPQTDPKGDRLSNLTKDWLATLREISRQATTRFQNRTGEFEPVRQAARALLDAELDLCGADKERIAILEKFIAEAKRNEKQAENLVKTGQAPASIALAAKADRLKAEIDLERLRAKIADKPAEQNAIQELRDQAELAEKQLAVKQAMVDVAKALKKKADAAIGTVRARVAEAQAAMQYEEKTLQRFEELAKVGTVESRLVDERRSRFESAKSRLMAAQATVAESEAQVMLETARVQQAQMEFEEAQLRLKQLKAKLGLGNNEPLRTIGPRQRTPEPVSGSTR